MKTHRKLIFGLFILSMMVMITSCGSLLVEGGKLVKKSKTPTDVLVDYEAEGTVPDNITYQLVNTEKGEAIFERSPDGSGTLFFKHWSDEAGDHFSVIVFDAYEVVVPADRSQPAKKYVYPDGTYSFKFRNNVKTPLPNDASVEPVATLIPK